MTTYGIEISQRQAGLDLQRAREGSEIGFVAAELLDEFGVTDMKYPTFRYAAAESGLLFAARVTLSGGDDVDHLAEKALEAVGDLTIPIIPAVTDVSFIPGAERLRDDRAEFIERIISNGGVVPLLQRYETVSTGRSLFYWSTADTFASFPGDDDVYWYRDGLEQHIVQYSETERVAGYSGWVAASATRLSRANLSATGWFKDFSETP